MNHLSAQPRLLTTAERALIIQRVLVDGWTSAKAAASFGVSERLVDMWVADYRRYGMSSLRGRNKTLAAEVVYLRIVRPVRGAARQIANGLRRLFAHDRRSQPFPLRHSNDDRRSAE
jgi:transposase-like protein